MVASLKRHPRLLPHERYLAGRFYKAQYQSKLPRRGPESTELYVASSADGLVGWLIVVPGLPLLIIGIATKVWDLAWVAAALDFAAACMYTLALVRVLQSSSAYHSYRRNRDSEHLTR
jgi:predicted membrane channel-forming protein YqfA (hemolysin III family)